MTVHDRPVSADREIAAGPPSDDEEIELPPFIGVPNNYLARRPIGDRFRPNLGDTGNIMGGGSGRQDATVFREPIYRDGDEFLPSSLSVEERARRQLAMRDAGLFTKNERFTVGVWDDNTRAAYRRLLEYANGAGLRWEEALSEYAAAKAASEDEEPVRAPLVVKITNPADIRRAFDTALPSVIGRKLRPDEVERFTRAYQAQEAAEQRQVYAMDETGGVVVEGPSLDTFIAERAEEIDPAGKTEMDLIGVSNPFFDLLDASGG